jgi:PhnO protein
MAMTSELSIRLATPGDFEAIYRFVCGLMEDTLDKEEMMRCYTECLAQPRNIYLLAVMGDEPVGYLSCHGQVLMHHCGLVCEIQELFVVDAHRSKGIGLKLLEAIRERIKDTGYKTLELSSNKRRVDAHRFYLANGFEQTSVKFEQEAMEPGR